MRVVLNCPYCSGAVMVERGQGVVRVAHEAPGCAVYRQAPDAFEVVRLLRPYYARELAFVPVAPQVLTS